MDEWLNFTLTEDQSPKKSWAIYSVHKREVMAVRSEHEPYNPAQTKLQLTQSENFSAFPLNSLIFSSTTLFFGHQISGHPVSICGECSSCGLLISSSSLSFTSFLKSSSQDFVGHSIQNSILTQFPIASVINCHRVSALKTARTYYLTMREDQSPTWVLRTKIKGVGRKHFFLKAFLSSERCLTFLHLQIFLGL